MRKTSFIVLTALGLALSCAAPAFAEKWRWFAIKGGAVAYDEESFKSDIKTSTIAANTLVYYEKPFTIDGQPYVFQAERAWFECLGGRYRWSQSALLDAAGGVVVSRPDGLWEPVVQGKGSAAMFQHMLCLNQYPPGGKEAPNFEALLKVVKTPAPAANAPDIKPAAAPEAKAVEPKVVAPAAKTADAKTAAPAKPLDLDALADRLLKTSEAKTPTPAPKAPMPKAIPAAPKAPASAAKPGTPPVKPTTPKVEPKLRPTTAP